MPENPKTLVTLGHRLDFKTFLSQFYVSGDGRIVKFYIPKDRYDGALPLSKPDFRARLVTDEVDALNLLSPNLEARQIRYSPYVDGVDDLGIEMNLIPPENLLSFLLDQGDPSTLPPDLFLRLARLIHTYHFNPQLCQPVSGLSLAHHVRKKVLLEIGFNRELIPRVGLSLPGNFDRWETLIEQFIDNNVSLLNARQRLLGEPYSCLGDARLDNCGVEQGMPFLLDPLAPVPEWRVLDRFLDAILIYVDLIVRGRLPEAQAYWTKYRRLYDQSIGIDNISVADQEEVRRGHTVMERIAYLQRLGLVVSVSAYSQDRKTTEEASQLLSQAYAELERDLDLT